MEYEYKVVPAPNRGQRRRGLRTGPERLAATLEDVIAEETAGGWEYLRADVLPMIESGGFLSRRREVQCAVLVFRRVLGAEEGARTDPRGLAEPALSPRREARARGFFSGARPSGRGTEPRVEPEARYGTEPEARYGTEPEARYGIEPEARHGTAPAARYGTEPDTRHRDRDEVEGGYPTEPTPPAVPEDTRRREPQDRPPDFSDIREALRRIDR